MTERLCPVCGRPLPAGADHRRKYHDECLAEGRRLQIAARTGRDPARPPIGAKTVAKLERTTPRDGGRAWTLYRELMASERTDVSYDEVVAALGGTPARANHGLAHLRRLELLVPRNGARRPVFEVRPPVTPDALAWVAALLPAGSLRGRER